MSWIDDLRDWLFPKGSKPHAIAKKSVIKKVETESENQEEQKEEK